MRRFDQSAFGPSTGSLRSATRNAAVVAATCLLFSACGADPEPSELPFSDESPGQETSGEENSGDETTAAAEGSESSTDATDLGPVKGVSLDCTVVGGDYGMVSETEPSVAGCGFVVDAFGFDTNLAEQELVLTLTSRPGTDDEAPARFTTVSGAADPDPTLPIVHDAGESGTATVTAALQADSGDEPGDLDRQLLVLVGTPDGARDERGHQFRLDASVEGSDGAHQQSMSFWVRSDCGEPPPAIPAQAVGNPAADAGVFDDAETNDTETDDAETGVNTEGE